MAYDIRAIANWFILRAERDGATVNHLRLQRLCFIAHGWYLGVYGKPLSAQPFESWTYGPVNLTLRESLMDYYDVPIRSPIYAPSGPDFDAEPYRLEDRAESPEALAKTERFLEHFWSEYKDVPTWELGEMTRNSKSPWGEVSKNGRVVNVVIDDSVTERHYKYYMTREKV